MRVAIRVVLALPTLVALAWLIAGCGAPPQSPQPRPAVAEAAAFTTVPGAPKGVPVEAVRYFRAIVREAGYYWGLSAPTPTFFAQVHQESRFRAEARSKYAAGLAQFTPQTAAGMQAQYPDLRVLCGEGSGCALDPGWAIRAMVLYDRALWRGRAFAAGDERLAFMLADYNGGAGWVNRERAACLAAPPAGEPGGCDATRYFGNVRDFCGKSVPARAAWACEENTRYPRVIIVTWRPLYDRWLNR
ncbi:MAG: hypothetical protein Q8Q14_17015 [Gemmatimonadales bacterium]|nr:hypothetical protein [Gemmatimonadales bacterium]